MTLMNAIRQHPPGGPASLAHEQLESPTPGPGEVLVRVFELAELVDEGRLRPLIDEVFPLVDARKAFERSEGEHRRGKIVLRVADR